MLCEVVSDTILTPPPLQVRPNLKRCILILRDIPEDTPLEEIEALFDEEGLPDVRGRVEFAINNNCYVRFDSETDAQTAFHSVINKSFNGSPIYVSCLFVCLFTCLFVCLLSYL